MTSHAEPNPDASAWNLVAILRLDEESPVKCECERGPGIKGSCGRKVYAAIHLIEWPDGRIECWGSSCYKKQLAPTERGKFMVVMFPEISGHPMTADERRMLDSNRAALVAGFRRECEERWAAAEHAVDSWRTPDALRAKAHATIKKQWDVIQADYNLDGHKGMFKKEIEAEYQRLLRGGV